MFIFYEAWDGRVESHGQDSWVWSVALPPGDPQQAVWQLLCVYNGVSAAGWGTYALQVYSLIHSLDKRACGLSCLLLHPSLG